MADEPVYCEACQMWLNGPRQMEDHKIGKKHEKKMRELAGFTTRTRRGADDFTCGAIRIQRRLVEERYGTPLTNSQWDYARNVLAHVISTSPSGADPSDMVTNAILGTVVILKDASTASDAVAGRDR